jgi:hypothetical protein
MLVCKVSILQVNNSSCEAKIQKISRVANIWMDNVLNQSWHKNRFLQEECLRNFRNFQFGCDFQNGHQNDEKLTLPGFQLKLIMDGQCLVQFSLKSGQGQP